MLFIRISYIDNNTATTQNAKVLQECSLKFCAVNTNSFTLAKNVTREENQQPQ
jgi:hypothetical protein